MAGMVGFALVMIQPLCVLRMYWLAGEHKNTLPQWPDKVKDNSILQYLVWIFPMQMMIPTHILGQSPFTVILWLLFWLFFIPTAASGDGAGAGVSFFMFGCPAMYFSCVNFFRRSSWQFVDLRFAAAVKKRQYENMCMKEGNFVLFVFVAAYAFVMNWYIAQMTFWDGENGGKRFILVVGFMAHSTAPLYYLYRLITDENADRTFRLFRSQLTDAFSDERMYTKIFLLIESAFFSLVVLVFSASSAGQLTGGFVVGLLFLFYYSYLRPYGDDMENLSDIISRVSSVFTCMMGLILATDSGASPVGVGVVLILVSLMNTAWFGYTLDLKDMFLGKFFLAIQLYAQAKASTYDLPTIQKLSESQLRQLRNSPIEMYVLSAAQKIRFAIYRKDVFLNGQKYRKLSDLGVTWLDLQQCGYNVVQLRKFGFTIADLMAVDAQLDDMGDRTDIRKLYEDGYQEVLLENEDGEHSVAALEAQHNLGVFYRDMGEHVKAMQTIETVYKALSDLLGTKHPSTMTCAAYLGEYRTFLGKATAGQGTQLLRDSFAFFSESEDYGPEHDITLQTMAHLGANLRVVGNNLEASQLLKDRLDKVVHLARESKLREDHPCTLDARLDYAMILILTGHFMTIKTLNLRRVMNRQKTLHGADNRDTLRLMDKYVQVLYKMGQSTEAMLQCFDAVNEKAATLGDEHSGTLSSKFELARCYIECGKLTSCDSLNLERSVALQEERLGANHPSTITSKVKLASLLGLRHKWDEALALYKECYDYRCIALGETHEMTLGVASNMAVIMSDSGKKEESFAMFEAILKKCFDTHGEDSQLTLSTMMNYAQTISNTGNLDRAVIMFKRCKDIAMPLLGDKRKLLICLFSTFHLFWRYYTISNLISFYTNSFNLNTICLFI